MDVRRLLVMLTSLGTFARTLAAVTALALTSAASPTAAFPQQVTVSISPPSANTYASGSLPVTIQWCAVGATLDPGERVITLNGQNVLASFGWSAGAQGGCDDYATSSGSVTLGSGINTFYAFVRAYYEPPPPPTCPPICDSRPDPLAVETAAPHSENALLPVRSGDVRSIEWVSGDATANWGTSAPIISLAPHSPGKLPVGADVVFTHSTPAYFSLGTGRSVSLAYNSSTVRSTPVIFFDVSSPSWASPTAHSVEVRRAADGSLLTLLNGAQIVYYTSAGTTPLRLSVAFDAQTNSLGTGFHNLNLTVTSHLSGGTQSTTVPTRVLVVDRNGSTFGRGVDLLGVQRVHRQAGTWSIVVAESNGSATFFDSFGQCQMCTFTSPAGEPSAMSMINDGTFGVMYRRTYPDVSRLEFSSDGRLRRAIGRFNDTTKYTWTGTDTLLTEIRDPMGKSLTLAYSGGKLQTVTDPGGRVTTYSMDGSGRLYVITDPDTRTTTLGYDGSHFLTSLTGRAGTVTNFTYDALRRVDSTYAPTMLIHTGANVRPTTIVTAAERVVWQPATPGTNAANKKLAVRPDTLFVTTVGPNGGTTRMHLDRFGSPAKFIGAYGETTIITRDTLGRALVSTGPNGHVTRVSYRIPFWANDSPYLESQVKDSTTGRTINYAYVSMTNDLRTVSGDATQLDYVYHSGSNGPVGALDSVLSNNRTIIESVHRPDALGRDTLVTNGGSRVMRIKYDSVWGNIREHTGPRGEVTRYHYDAVGRIDSAWVASSDSAFAYTHDAMNRRTQLTNPLGQTTQYVHGPAMLTRLVDPKGQVYKFAHNPLGLLTVQHDLGDTTKADTLKYDEAGNLRMVRTRRGDVVTMTYDLNGRMLSRSGPDFPVDSFKYDPVGRWFVAWNSNQRDSSAFDQAGRLSATRQSMLGGVGYALSYTYNVRNQLISRTAPSGGNVARFVYNSPGTPIDTLCGAGACVAYRRNSAALVDTLTYNPGLAGSWKRLQYKDSTLAVRRDSFNLVALDTLYGGRWTYDLLGRLGTEDRFSTGFGKKPWYRYDALGRLIDACDDNSGGGFFTCLNEYGGESHPLLGGTPAYAYDLAGNRVDPAANATVGSGNRVTAFRGFTVGYDANGSIISKTGPGASYTYTWDALGRLTEVRNGGILIAEYKYDALGRRVTGTAPSATTERYVYDRDHVAMDVSGSHVVKTEYGYSPGLDRVFAIKHAQTPQWTAAAIPDPVNGSIRGLVNVSGGTVRKKYQMTPWGQTGADTGVATRYRLAGREYDQITKLYYMRARYYDPELGRFLTEDPTGPAGGLNLYTYAGNDPVNNSDPSGTECYSIYEREVFTTTITNGPSITTYGPWVLVGISCDDGSGGGGGWVPGGGGAGPAGQPPRRPPPRPAPADATRVSLEDRPREPGCFDAAGDLALALALDVASGVGVGMPLKMAATGVAKIGVGYLARGAASTATRSIFTNKSIDAALASGTVLVTTGAVEAVTGATLVGAEVVAQDQIAQAVGKDSDALFEDPASLIPGVSTGRALGALRSCKKGTP